MVIKRKFKFRSPSHCKIIIYERIGSERIQNLILPNLPVFVFDPLLDKIYFSFRIACRIFLNLNKFECKSIKGYSTKLRGIIGQLWRIYILSVINVISPKVVITIIDNHPIFHWLCEHYHGAEFIAIQNGSRTRGQLNNDKSKYTLQHYFCFGNYEKDLFADYGYRVENYYPVGSLLSGYHMSNNTFNDKPEYDICVISAWRGKIGDTVDVQTSMKAMKIMDEMLSRYVQRREINASVMMRSEPDSDDREIPVYGNEKIYFQTIYPDSVTLIDPHFKNANIYSEILKSDLIISMGSTVPREAFGFGKKILYCDFTGTKLYNDYDPVILFVDEDYDLLEQRLDELLDMPQLEYENRTKKYASYLMNNYPENPPHKIIRQKINEILAH